MRTDKNMRLAKQIILITVLSLLGGGIFYTLWLIAFLTLTKFNVGIFESLLWIFSPIITALGFTTGVLLANRILNKKNSSFLSVYFWPLTGCIFGAILVYWFGPMLIVFSMLVVGTFSVFLREITAR